MAGMPHTTVPSSIPVALRTIRAATTPGRVSAKYLEANGLAKGEGHHMVGLLRSVGFVTAGGKPTDLWTGYQQRSERSRLLADAIRNSYAPLFDEFPAAHRETPRSLARVIRRSTGYSEHHVDKTLESFQELCRLADFSAAGVVKSAAPRQLRFTAQTRDEGRKLLIRGVGEAQQCVRHGLHRPAHVSAWNGFLATSFSLLAADAFAATRLVRPTWKGSTLEELCLRTPGAHLVGMLGKLELCTEVQADRLSLLLQRRNDCAHPTTYDPTLAEALAYISAVHSAGIALLERAAEPNTSLALA